MNAFLYMGIRAILNTGLLALWIVGFKRFPRQKGFLLLAIGQLSFVVACVFSLVLHFGLRDQLSSRTSWILGGTLYLDLACMVMTLVGAWMLIHGHDSANKQEGGARP